MNFLNRYGFHIIGAIAGITYLVIGIFKSTNSTAAIGFLFIPVFALFGAFVGDAIKYLLDILRGIRKHSPIKTLSIVIVVVICTYTFIQSQIKNRNLKMANDPHTSSEQLVELLKSNNPEITRAIAANASLPASELENLLNENLTNFDIMNGVVRNPNLTTVEMEKIAKLNRSDFRGNTEYEIYQTYVWAPLAKRQDIPENLIHELAKKENPKHFFILALLESKYLTCDEKKKFLPQENPVLENSIRQSMESQSCHN